MSVAEPNDQGAASTPTSYDPAEAAAIDRAVLTVRLARLADEMEALVAEAPHGLPVGARAVVGTLLELFWAPLTVIGLAAALLVLHPLAALAGVLAAWGLWSAAWRRGEAAGLAEGAAAQVAFDAACPIDHPLLVDDPEARRERAATRPPRPEIGLSVQLHEPGARLARLAFWALVLFLQIGVSLAAILALAGPAALESSLLRALLVPAITGSAIAALVIAHDLDITARAALLPGVAAASGVGLLFALRCMRLGDQMRELETEAARLGLEPLFAAIETRDRLRRP